MAEIKTEISGSTSTASGPRLVIENNSGVYRVYVKVRARADIPECARGLFLDIAKSQKETLSEQELSLLQDIFSQDIVKLTVQERVEVKNALIRANIGIEFESDQTLVKFDGKFGLPVEFKSFTGRKVEITKLLSVCNQSSVSIQKIYGAGGIGKTQLINKFVRKQLKTGVFNWVVWFRIGSSQKPLLADNREEKYDNNLAAQMLELAEQLSVNTKSTSERVITERVYQQLTKGGRGCVVFDDVQDYSDIRQVVTQAIDSNFITVLITTRNSNEWGPHIATLNLSIFNRDEACAYIQKVMRAKVYTRDECEILAENLNYFPLAISQALSYMGTITTIEDYIKEFNKTKEKQRKLLSKKALEEEDYNETVYTSTNILLNIIKHLCAYEILNVCSYLKSETPIAIKFFNRWVKDVSALNEAISILKRYGLVKESNEPFHIEMHKIVQLCVVIADTIDQEIDRTKKISLAFGEYISKTDSRQVINSHREHLRVLDDRLEKHLSALMCKGYFLVDYYKNQRLKKLILSIHGHIYFLKGKLDKWTKNKFIDLFAIFHFTNCLNVLSHYPEYFEIRALCYYYIGVIHFRVGQHKKVKKHILTARAAFKRLNWVKKIAKCDIILGMAYLKRHKVKKAVFFLSNALIGYQSIENTPILSMVRSKQALAVAMLEAGNLEHSNFYLVDALNDIESSNLNDSRQERLLAFSKLGVIKKFKGDTLGSLNYFKQAKEVLMSLVSDQEIFLDEFEKIEFILVIITACIDIIENIDDFNKCDIDGVMSEREALKNYSSDSVLIIKSLIEVIGNTLKELLSIIYGYKQKRIEVNKKSGVLNEISFALDYEYFKDLSSRACRANSIRRQLVVEYLEENIDSFRGFIKIQEQFQSLQTMWLDNNKNKTNLRLIKESNREISAIAVGRIYGRFHAIIAGIVENTGFLLLVALISIQLIIEDVNFFWKLLGLIQLIYVIGEVFLKFKWYRSSLPKLNYSKYEYPKDSASNQLGKDDFFSNLKNITYGFFKKSQDVNDQEDRNRKKFVNSNLLACFSSDKSLLCSMRWNTKNPVLTIQRAVMCGTVEELKSLLENYPRDANVTIRIANKWSTALHIAVQHGRHECVQMLLGCIGFTITPDAKELSALDYAIQGGDIQILQHFSDALLRKYSKLQITPTQLPKLVRACAQHGDEAGLKLLIHLKVFIDEPGSKTGQTALHLAVIKGHPGCVKLLMEAKADPHKKDREERTPVSFSNNDSEIRRVLLGKELGELPSTAQTLH